MRATEFIRSLLDLIDSVDEQQQVTDYEDENLVTTADAGTQYSNTPDEKVTPSSTVFSIGDDVHKPKNPADIRADSFSMYPDWQARKKN